MSTPDLVRPDGRAAEGLGSPRTPWRSGASLLALGGLVALVFLLLAVTDTLGAMWAAVAGAVVLWPLRQTRVGRSLLIAGGILVAAFALSRLGGVLAPFVLVFVVAYLLDPVVAAAERRWNWPRWATTAGITLGVVGVIVGGILLLIPALVGQIESLVGNAIVLAQRLPGLAANSLVLDRLEDTGLIDRAALLDYLSSAVPNQVQALAGQIPALLTLVTRSVGALVGLVTTLALVPVLLFYTLRDFPKLRDGMIAMLPRYRGRRDYVDTVGHVFGSYFRGQILISSASAVIVTVPLVLLGVPFSLLIGLAAGFLNFIPNIGSILTYVLGVVLMLAFGTVQDLIIVLVVLAVQAILEQAVLTPNIMGQQVGLHPVVIMLAVFVMSGLFGLLGLILAVPAAALAATAVRARREHFVLDLGTDAPMAEAPPEAHVTVDPPAPPDTSQGA